ncbi:MAG: hypothetical protein KKG04_06740 [Candidatus Thermoplasmatota archaeon]|nr:hypothetical protein [Candidatus Thermoplasmatota archaeon]
MIHIIYSHDNSPFSKRINHHCLYDTDTGCFYCKQTHTLVSVDWSRRYAFCNTHGTL